MTKIIVKNQAIKTLNKEGIDYICITDIARQKNSEDPNAVIGNWMRNRNTIEFLGIWESLYNSNFNPIEFEGFRKDAGLNAFTTVHEKYLTIQKVTNCKLLFKFEPKLSIPTA